MYGDVNIDHLKDETLKWCNGIRKEKGLDILEQLPKGKLADSKSCPCGAATGYAVGLVHYFEDGEREPIGDLPEAVRQFVRVFDDGKIPELVE